MKANLSQAILILDWLQIFNVYFAALIVNNTKNVYTYHPTTIYNQLTEEGKPLTVAKKCPEV